MKVFLYIILLTGINISSYADIKIFGNTDYTSNKTNSLVTTLNSEYKIKIFEPICKSYMMYLGGTISHDLDHFGKTSRTNCFTNLGIEF